MYFFARQKKVKSGKLSFFRIVRHSSPHEHELDEHEHGPFSDVEYVISISALHFVSRTRGVARGSFRFFGRVLGGIPSVHVRI